MERAFQRLNLTRSEIEHACRHYFQNRGSLQSYKAFSQGAVNTTFKICWDGEWFVLRFFARDKHLASFESCIYQLIQATVPVPELLFTSSLNETYPFAIFRFCNQPHIFDATKAHSHKLSHDIGCALAAIHAFRFPEAGLFGSDLSIETLFGEGSSPYFDYCLNHLIPGSPAWIRLGDERAQRIIRFMEERQEYFPVIQSGGCLVHSDFKPVNLLWDERQGLAVLDWEFAHSGDGIMDFGILLRHFHDFPLSISHLEKGYRDNGGALPSGWLQRARITDFINVVQLLNRPSEQPNLFLSLIQSLDFTIGYWEKLPIALGQA